MQTDADPIDPGANDTEIEARPCRSVEGFGPIINDNAKE
jgi:hypothetical protein